jgi:hypothetical protein
LRAAVAEWLSSMGDANAVKLEQRKTRIYSRLVALEASVRRWERVKAGSLDTASIASRRRRRVPPPIASAVTHAAQ